MNKSSVLVWAAALATAGCGYIGEPLPPLLHIPVAVTDLAAVERGDRIIVQFTVPRLTTEATALRNPPDLDVRMGPVTDPWNADSWSAQATKIGPGVIDNGRARYEIQVNGWPGKQIAIGVRAIGSSGRLSGWSNFATLTVLPPLAPPVDVRAEAVPAGVRLSWQGQALLYRIYRRGPDEQSFSPAGDADRQEWTDTQTAYGKTYAYTVQALSGKGAGAAESNNSAQVSVTPVDTFPPKPPAGLTAVAGTGNIGLVWERNTEPDFAAYRVYRVEGAGELKPIADTGVTPSYGDRTVESGKTYRYAVSAIDTAGNESKPCDPVEVTAQ